MKKIFVDSRIRQIFDRANLQTIRGLITNDMGDEHDIDPRPYHQKITEDEARMIRWIESTYPDGPERDEIFSKISDAITAHEDAYFEMGMKCGARLLYQLLLEEQPGTYIAKAARRRGGRNDETG